MSHKEISKGRRKFLKTTAVGTGVAAVGALSIKDADAAVAKGWKTGMAINKNIPNTRVVCCKDEAMVSKSCKDITNFPDMTPAAGQNTAAVTARIQANMDEMAKSLAQKKTAAEAWGVIFQKSKANWADVKVAIKINGIAENHPRVAIVDKLCKELHTLGVPLESIILYDGCHNAWGKYNNFLGNGLPAGVVVSDGNGLLGGTQDAEIPAPDAGNFACSKNIADGTIDILINCACCKGHGPDYGNTTMTMKNHFGTFTPKPHGHGDTKYLFAINKSDAIVGGKVPRQQLCIIDALWSNCSGPGGIPNADTHALVMGTCSPVVDYLTVKNIREQAPMSCSHNSAVIDRFLSEFGFTKESLTWVSVPPAKENA